MAIKSEVFPITLQIKPDSSLNLNSSTISINLEESSIEIYNDRGGRITVPADKQQLFVDNSNLIIGYLWNTGTIEEESRFNIQDYYLFTFLVAINYQIEGETSPKIFKLSYSTKKLLEASSTF